jgi:hypothetical protein
MVRSIVIPHDPARSPRLRHLASASEFQDAVDGWLEPIEIPALGVTVYVNEAARREHHPINCRAMALWWLYTADPTRHPIFLGDVVLTSTDADEQGGDAIERIVQDIFEQREFVIEVLLFGDTSWRDSYARFSNVFDAATWCMILAHTLRPGAQLRLRSQAPSAGEADESVTGVDALW